ncbi:hypothetical protein BURPS1106B_A0308 [Burkholderia pseudomallei 1106b]|nr:hypothetical protein BURPS1106B_A0308 [Burkholderia pseudomallei 1106b]
MRGCGRHRAARSREVTRAREAARSRGGEVTTQQGREAARRAKP